MAKKVKKNLKLRRRIRKTMGAVCLITALIVAAIPVPGAAAAVGNEIEGTKYTWDNQIWKGGGANNESYIPVVPKDCKEIYTTGDGTYQFAFVNESDTSLNKIAVILGYNGRNLQNNYLEIPNTVNAYTKYNENEGTFTGYVAVSKSQKPLFYKRVTITEEPVMSGGDQIGTTEIETVEYLPCYYSDRNSWSDKVLTDFYYYDDTAASYVQTTDEKDQWIKNISVDYIGNQSLVSVDSSTSGAVQGWQIAEDSGKVNDTPNKGVFASNANIRTLVVGEELKGIGNYAFYGCTNLETITLGNGLVEIGKYAFADCINMYSIGLDFTSNIQYISDHAFMGCSALEEFILPAGVQRIFDHAFEGCYNLKNVDISGIKAQKNVNLKDLGYYVFSGCTSLEGITIPQSYQGDDSSAATRHTLMLNNFKNCSNLKRITLLNSSTKPTVSESTNISENYTVEEFKEDVHPTFYFEADDISQTHEFTKANAIAFKYLNSDVYEIIIEAEGENITYQVNSQQQLLWFDMSGPVKEVEIPATIGPYGISAINAGSFSGNCFLEKITIPATVTAINENAFKGCHNLKHVIFNNAATITHIGINAFATQVVDLHKTACTNKDFLTTVSKPVLTFTGAIGSNVVPFAYAMSPGSNINAGEQLKTYITYYSGWPTNLEIKYNPDKSTAELVDYPTFAELKSGVYNKLTYPYMTQEYENAGKAALDKYEAWLSSPNTTEVTQNEWEIINAVLHISVPDGVTGIKSGLFSGAVVSGSNAASADTTIQSVTLASVEEIEPYTFDGCTSLKEIRITGGAKKIDDYAFASRNASDSNLETFTMTAGGESIGNYAFMNNNKLTGVTVSPEVQTLGLRPFRGCKALSNVSFGGGPYFTCDNFIIYSLKDGVKDTVVECLEARTKTVNKAELAGITGLADEAFMDVTGIGSVDLSSTTISRIPQYAFAGTTGLFSATLPNTCLSISSNAFHGSGVQYVEIPNSVTFIDPSAFNTEKNPDPDKKADPNGYKNIEFYCEPGTAAAIYADEYDSIDITDKPIEKYFTVTFWDYGSVADGNDVLTIVDTQSVLWHDDAVPPEPVGREGYRFKEWLPDYHDVSRDMDVVAQYEKIDSEEKKFTVNFIDWDDKVIYTQQVNPGEDAFAIVPPAREGYIFDGWRPAITNVTKSFDTYAQYKQDTGGGNNGGGDNGGGNNGGGDNGGGNNGGGNNGGGNNGGNDVSGGNNTPATLYTLTVENGSGSGSYVAGAQVIIIANEPASTQQFSKWTTDNTAVKFASTTVGATVVTMPAANAKVTATYAAKSGSNNGGSNNNNNNNNGGGNTITGGNNGTVTKPGTVIVIDKNGFSNTGVVSAKVNGSSDNFVIKITESSEATEAVLNALLAEYGSLDNLKYFPMDISLYDSTGKTKITDTTGLSITITLPLPDSLIQYAGNNKVAGVVNNKLDKLTPKFTTIEKVACVTFTAEHFSPYVIYVDTTDLSASGSTDDSPKTGDIHPKWFLAIGLACLSVVLFAKKDRNGRKVVPA